MRFSLLAAGALATVASAAPQEATSANFKPWEVFSVTVYPPSRDQTVAEVHLEVNDRNQIGELGAGCEVTAHPTNPKRRTEWQRCGNHYKARMITWTDPYNFEIELYHQWQNTKTHDWMATGAVFSSSKKRVWCPAREETCEDPEGLEILLPATPQTPI